MYYTDVDGRRVLDATAGLWCCNAGHGRQEISDAVSRQLKQLDYAPSFQIGHPLAFGRLGSSFASQCWDATLDMITIAEALTNGAVPMGAVLINDDIYQACMSGPEELIEFFHGCTYSGHPVSTVAALATLNIYKKEKLCEHVNEIEGVW